MLILPLFTVSLHLPGWRFDCTYKMLNNSKSHDMTPDKQYESFIIYCGTLTIASDFSAIICQSMSHIFRQFENLTF